MEMKKRFIIFIYMMSLIALLSSAQAINRSTKTSDSGKNKETTEPKEVQEKRSWEVTRKTSLPSDKTVDKNENQGKFDAKSREGKEDYDYFIDKNKNGIDDRQEGNMKPPEIKRREDSERKTPSASEKTPSKTNPVAKSRERTKDQDNSGSKKETKPEKIEKKERSEKR
jgi:hypothetical protein